MRDRGPPASPAGAAPGSCAATPGSRATACAGVSVEFAFGHRDHAAHFVGQLAHVAGPGVEQQVFERLVVERQASLLLFVAVLAQVVIDERRDLLAPLAQRRQLQADDVEAVEEVLAEAALGDELFEVGVGGGDDAHVDLDRLRLAERVDLVRLEEAQQLGLDVDGRPRRSRRGRACRRRPTRMTPANDAVGAGEGAACGSRTAGFRACRAAPRCS